MNMWVALLTLLTMTPAETTSFWLDTARLSPEETTTLTEALSRMAKGKGLSSSVRREGFRFLVRVRLGGYGADTDSAGAASVFGSERAGHELEVVEAAGPTMTARVDISVVDVTDGKTLFDRAVKCRLPLTRSGRIMDPALRGTLSHTIDVMSKAGKDGPPEPKADVFGVSERERERLGPEELARLLSREASRATKRGHDEAALSLLAEAQPILKATGARHEEGLVWERLAGMTASTGRPIERARDYAEQAVRVARESGDRTAEARALTCLAVMEARSSNYPRSLELLHAARRMSQEQGDALTEATVLSNLAGLTAMRGGFDRARGLQDEALTLVRTAGSPRAEARFRVSTALIQSHLDSRDRAATLEELSRARELARQTADRGIERDVAFAEARVRFSTTSLNHLMEGEIDAMRALQLSRWVSDPQGEAAALALLGAFAHRLVRPEQAAEYLALAQERARPLGYLEIVIDSLQLLGEMAPSLDRGVSILEQVVLLRRQTGDLRGEVKTLSDLSRLLSGLQQEELALERYRESVGALERYVAERTGNPYAEDIEESFLVALKSLVATRTELPYLDGYLELRQLTVVPDPTWAEQEQ